MSLFFQTIETGRIESAERRRIEEGRRWKGREFVYVAVFQSLHLQTHTRSDMERTCNDDIVIFIRLLKSVSDRLLFLWACWVCDDSFWLVFLFIYSLARSHHQISLCPSFFFFFNLPRKTHVNKRVLNFIFNLISVNCRNQLNPEEDVYKTLVI